MFPFFIFMPWMWPCFRDEEDSSPTSLKSKSYSKPYPSNRPYWIGEVIASLKNDLKNPSIKWEISSDTSWYWIKKNTQFGGSRGYTMGTHIQEPNDWDTDIISFAQSSSPEQFLTDTEQLEIRELILNIVNANKITLNKEKHQEIKAFFDEILPK